MRGGEVERVGGGDSKGQWVRNWEREKSRTGNGGTASEYFRQHSMSKNTSETKTCCKPGTGSECGYSDNAAIDS